jgi:hypothetical protein
MNHGAHRGKLVHRQGNAYTARVRFLRNHRQYGVRGIRASTGAAFPAAALSIALLAAASPASATEDTPVRSFAIGPIAGVYSGFGAAALLRAEPVGLWLSGGYMPLLIVGSESTSNATRFNFHSSVQMNADAVIGPVSRRGHTDLSLVVGYRYNSVLGHGVGAGIAIEIGIAEHWAATVLVGPSIFPSAESHLDDHGYPSDRDASLPWLQGGAGVTLAFVP